MIDVFKALGDANRLRIMSIIIKGKVCVCELENILELSQSNVSRHLNKLKTAELIISTKKAQWIYYEINEVFFNENKALLTYLNSIFNNEVNYVEDKNKLEKYKLNSCEEPGCCLPGGKK